MQINSQKSLCNKELCGTVPKVGVLELDLFMRQVHSLKSKRRILKSIKDKVRHRFNVSIAEIAGGNKWQRGVLAVACVNSDKELINSILSKIVNLVERQHQAELTDYKIEFI